MNAALGLFPQTLKTRRYSMLGYFLHGLVAAVEATVPWIVRHHIEANAEPRRHSPDAEHDVAATTAVGAAASSMAFGAAIGLLACFIDTHMAHSSLVRSVSPSVAAANLETVTGSRSRRRATYARRVQQREAAEAATVHRPAYLIGIGATVSCTSALLPAHLLSVAIIVLLFCTSAACGAAARTDAVIKAAQHMWRAEFNQEWSLAHDDEYELTSLGSGGNRGSAENEDGERRR